MKLCSNTPNCVCSIEKRDSHFIEPFPRINSQDKEKIKVICSSMKAKLIKETNSTLYYVFTTKILRFKDDVEFKFSKNKIDVRSASRVGHSDLGTNRKRIEKIRKQFIS